MSHPLGTRPAPGPDQPPIPVRLVTFNTHHGVGVDGRHDLPRLATVLAAADADLICLQEVDRYYGDRSEDVDQALLLSRALDMQLAWGPAIDEPRREKGLRRQYGNALLSRLPILVSDVHHAYAAELVHPDGLTGRVHQLTVSPLHNQAPHPIRVGFRIGWSRWARRLTTGLSRLARVRPSELDWAKQAGPYFGNQLGELVLHDRRASFRLFVIDRDDTGAERLQLVAELPLSDSVAAEVTG